MVKGHLPPDVQVHGVGTVGHVLFFVDDLIDFTGADGTFRHVPGQLDDPAQRSVDHGNVGREPQQLAQGQGPDEDLLAAEIEVKILADGHQKGQDGEDDAPVAVSLVHAFGEAVRVFRIVGDLPLFAAVGLDHQDAA